MKIIDISWPISEHMTAYKDRSVVTCTATKHFEKDNARESVVQLGTHSGTHIDAPAHFLEQGKSINELPLDATVGLCIVVDCSYVQSAITRKDVEKLELRVDEIVLFKTMNSNHAPTDPFDSSFVFLDSSAASCLVDHQVKAVGIDYLGIERGQQDHDTHITLLKKNIPIIEGLRLKHIAAGQYELYCLPLALQGLEAAPARAVLLQR